jgi:hypothetical protein
VSGHSSTNHTLPPAPRSVLLQDYNPNSTFLEALKTRRSVFFQFSLSSCYFSHMAPNIFLINLFSMTDGVFMVIVIHKVLLFNIVLWKRRLRGQNVRQKTIQTWTR